MFLCVDESGSAIRTRLIFVHGPPNALVEKMQFNAEFLGRPTTAWSHCSGTNTFRDLTVVDLFLVDFLFQWAHYFLS